MQQGCAHIKEMFAPICNQACAHKQLPHAKCPCAQCGSKRFARFSMQAYYTWRLHTDFCTHAAVQGIAESLAQRHACNLRLCRHAVRHIPHASPLSRDCQDSTRETLNGFCAQYDTAFIQTDAQAHLICLDQDRFTVSILRTTQTQGSSSTHISLQLGARMA